MGNFQLYIPYRCKVEQPEAQQRTGMTNFGMEMCILSMAVRGIFLRVFGSSYLKDERPIH